MPLRICVCTSFSAAAEPRAPRHAAAMAALSPECEVTFVDAYPRGDDRPHRHPVDTAPRVRRVSYRFPTQERGKLQWAGEKIWHRAAALAAARFGMEFASAFSERARSVARRIDAVDADLYFGHCADTLLPVWRTAKRRNALAMFDCMELYSEMGDGQSAGESRMTARLERRLLPQLDLITTTSPRLSEELERRYGKLPLLAISNAAPVTTARLPEKERGFSLYWRNAVVGFGQRGLGDILEAMQLLPRDVVLNLQGRLPEANGRALREYLLSNGLERRVVIHPPCAPDEAVLAAARFHVGICAERPEVANHWYTVSNKLFDYHMAGLAVVVSGLPSLRDVVQESGAGLLYRPGDPRDLAAKVMELYRDPALRQKYAAAARRYAMLAGNAEAEMKRLREAVRQMLRRKRADYGWDLPPETAPGEVETCVGY